MNQPQQPPNALPNTLQAIRCLSLLLGLVMLTLPAHAESLFRASASYSADEPMTPRSLFTQPRPQHIGDIVTVQIDESTTQNNTIQFRATKTHTLTENGSTLFNNAIKFYLGKLPFIKTNLVKDVVPSFDGLSNENSLATQVQSTKTSRVTENVSCQVVQVLPNGNLIVQGKKIVAYSKEMTDLYVTGIVNPYFIDRNNTIKSKQVGNLQFVMGGKGVISRQMNDGVASKLYQFFN